MVAVELTGPRTKQVDQIGRRLERVGNDAAI